MAGKSGNSAYSILVGVQLETNNIQDQLNKLKIDPIKIEIDGANLSGLEKTLSNLDATLKNVSGAMKNFGQTTDQSTKSQKKNKEQTDENSDAMGKLALEYQEANAIMSKSIDIISSMVDQVFEMNSALTEFSKVSDLSGSSLDSYVSKLQDLGSEVGRTGKPKCLSQNVRIVN